MKKITHILTSISVFVLSARFACAAKGADLSSKTLQQLVTDFIVKFGKYTITFLVALTVLMFLVGLMKYMFKGQGSDTARSDGRKLMLWGVIGIFVMTSVWGLVAIFANTIGHESIVIPQFK